MMNEQHIHVISRGLIYNDNLNKVLLVKDKNKGHFYLPGGHLNYNESAQHALQRNLNEDLTISIDIGNFVSAFENSYENYGKPYHEINLIFKAYSPYLENDSNPHSRQSHLIYTWVRLHELKNIKMMPEFLIPLIPNWLKNIPDNWASNMLRFIHQ